MSDKLYSQTNAYSDREKAKHREGLDERSSISIFDQSKLGWGKIERTKPTATSDRYIFYSRTNPLVVTDTLTIVYETSEKEEIVSIERS